MGPCLSHPKQQHISNDFYNDKQISIPESTVKVLKPLTTTLYNVLRKQSNLQVLHTSQQLNLIRKSNKIDIQAISKGNIQIIYNFKNVVVVGKAEKYIKIGQVASIKNMYVVGQKQIKRFVQKFSIFDKNIKRNYEVSNIPLLVFSQDELAINVHKKQNSKHTFTIFIHSKKYSNKNVYQQLNISKIIESITDKPQEKQKQIQNYVKQFKNIRHQHDHSVILIHPDYIKQADLRKIIGQYLVSYYSIGSFSANGYLKRFLPSQQINNNNNESNSNNQLNPSRKTFYSDKKNNLNQYTVLGKQQKQGKQNKKSIKDLNPLQSTKNIQNQNFMPTQSAIRRLQSPATKLELDQSTKPYFKILKELYKQSNEEIVQRAYSINTLLLSNICNHSDKQQSYRKVKITNKNISQVSKYKSGKDLLIQNGWVQDGDHDGNWVNKVEVKYLKIFRTDLDLAHKIYKDKILK